MQKVDKEKTRYYLAKIHILFRGNFRTQEQKKDEKSGKHMENLQLPVS